MPATARRPAACARIDAALAPADARPSPSPRRANVHLLAASLEVMKRNYPFGTFPEWVLDADVTTNNGDVETGVRLGKITRSNNYTTAWSLPHELAVVEMGQRRPEGVCGLADAADGQIARGEGIEGAASAPFELLPPLTAESSPPCDRAGSAHGGGSHRGWPSLVAGTEAFNRDRRRAGGCDLSNSREPSHRSTPRTQPPSSSASLRTTGCLSCHDSTSAT
jgi:hypothetical protein